MPASDAMTRTVIVPPSQIVVVVVALTVLSIGSALIVTLTPVEEDELQPDKVCTTV